jgi:heterodisulfide reductase subunit B
MKYSYYPGCSNEKFTGAYETSIHAIAGPLGLELVEIEDWNCCGASEYMALNLTAAYSLIGRNLAQAAKNKELSQVVAPCSLCYVNLRKCDKYLGIESTLTDHVRTALAEDGLSYKPGTLKVRHLLDVIHDDIGLEALAAKATHPLHGLRVAPYYGCLIVRPEFHNGGDDTEFPTGMDEVIRALGAEVIDYPMKAQCCGGHMTQISEAVGFELIRRILKAAVDREADVIAALCPMCQVNLDAFQGAVNRHFGTDYHIPVLYFTQLIGLAMGISQRELGIGGELVDARPALSRIGSEMAAAAAAEPRRPRKDDKALPMPAPLKKA